MATGTIQTSANNYSYQNLIGPIGLGVANEIWVHPSNGSDQLYVNWRGYLGGTSQFRSTGIYNGKNGIIGYFDASTSRLGLGTTGPTVQLDLTTDGARKLTTTTWATGSDSRVKKNVVNADLRICYDTVMGLSLKRFTWDDTYYPEVDDRNAIGFIAQEVKEVFPNAVSLSEELGFSDFHTLNVDQIYKTMFGAIQYLVEKIKSAESLEELKNSL